MSDNGDLNRLLSACQRDPTDVLVGRNLRRARLDNQMSIPELAGRVSIEEGELCAFELGFRRPSPELLFALAAALSQRVPALFREGRPANTAFSGPSFNGSIDHTNDPEDRPSDDQVKLD